MLITKTPKKMEKKTYKYIVQEYAFQEYALKKKRVLSLYL